MSSAVAGNDCFSPPDTKKGEAGASPSVMLAWLPAAVAGAVRSYSVQARNALTKPWP